MIRLLFVFLFINTFAVSAQTLKTRNVVIVTLDGYRWKELFCGADPNILFNDKYVNDTSVVHQFWHEQEEQRRRKLMPFMWNVIGTKGQLYGNRKYGNRMRLANMSLYSYAGYAEMFVGFADRRTRKNDAKVNPNHTVLETIKNQPEFRGDVAAFATWGVMPYILREEISEIPVNAGNDQATTLPLTDTEHALNALTEEGRRAYGDRDDSVTFLYAFEYVKKKRPRVLYISFGETDEHAHDGRYDDYLKSAHRTDSMLSVLWTWLQSQEQYRDQTTLIIATDHGRGTSASGWRRHALLFRGSRQTWLAVMGPDTPPSGEMVNKQLIRQKQLAATIAAFLSVPYTNRRKPGDVIHTVFQDERLPETDSESWDSARR